MTIQRNEHTVLSRVKGNRELIPFAMKDINGAVINLTGRTVTCQIIKISDNTVKLATGACTLTTAVSGEGYYAPTSIDVDTVGKYAVYFNDDSTPARRWPYDGARFQLHILETNEQQVA